MREGAAQWTRTWDVPAQRGTLFDRNGNEMAISVPGRDHLDQPEAHRERHRHDPDCSTTCSTCPTRRSPTCWPRSPRRSAGFVYVARQVDSGARRPDLGLELPGVNVDREDRREMPGGDTGRSVIGRTNIDGVGHRRTRAAVRRHAHRHRRRACRARSRPADRSIPGSETVTEAPVAGDDLVLTIDRSIQFSAEQVLLEKVSEIGARGATAIVMRPRHRRDLRDGVGAAATTRPAPTR